MASLVRVAPYLPVGLRPSGTGLLDSVPEEVRAALRRDGLGPAPELTAGPPVREVPLPLGARGWLVTGYDEVRAVLSDAGTFSNDFGHLVGRPGIGQELDPGGLGLSDPPDHTVLRRLLAPEFSARRLETLQPRVREIVDAQLDVLEREADGSGCVDLLEHFARPVPWLVICELLGIREGDREALRELGSDRFDLSGGIIGSLGTVKGWKEHLRQLVARARADPEPGLIARLTAAAGQDLDDVQLAGVVDGLITGGLETTASMLALGALMLMEDPVSLEGLRVAHRLPGPLVDELLRELSVVQVAFPRFARAAVRVGEVDVRRDDIVICSLSAANHDLGERSSPHVAFGHGLHRCVGAGLARMELEVALSALVRRFPGIRPAVPVQELAFHRDDVVFGVRALPVLLGTT